MEPSSGISSAHIYSVVDVHVTLDLTFDLRAWLSELTVYIE